MWFEAGGKRFGWMMGSWNNERCAFIAAPKVLRFGARRKPFFQLGQRYTCEIRVRTPAVGILLDGKQAFADRSALTGLGSPRIPIDADMPLVIWSQSAVVLHSIRLTPVGE